MSGDARAAFRVRIGDLLGVPPDRVALFARGRVALFAILRALDIGPGDEVIVPAFTCVAVPNAILYAGARPAWVDIDPRTYCIEPVSVESAIGPRTRAIMAQNTFGLSADLDALTAIARRHGLAVIDDCTHGLGGAYHEIPNGAAAPFSFFSTQWSKPISTGLGGFAVDRDGALGDRIRLLEATAVEPSAVRAAMLRALIFGRERAGAGRLLRGGRAVYRTVSRLGIVPASSSREELDGTSMPDGFLAGLSERQAQLGSDRLAALPAAVSRRRWVAHRYSDWLVSTGRTAAFEPAGSVHAFLRYPVRVADRRRFAAAAAASGVDVGDWFVSPVHPVLDRLDRWGYVEGSAPNAERACRDIVNLPTDPSLSEAHVERVLALIGQHLDLIR